MQMKKNLKNKRLLLLGGTYNAEMIKKYAEKNDIILVSTGNNANDHPLVNISDIFAKGNVKSADDISRVIRENKIDGVFPGGNEDVIPVCIKAAKMTGINCYVTQEQWDITANKRVFKNVCRKFDVPVVPEYSIDDIIKNETTVKYPVIVKPIDGSGSRGVFLAYDKDELLEYSQKALGFSRSKEIMVEEYMFGHTVVIYFTVVDGEFYLSSMTDKYTKSGEYCIGTLPQAHLYPSRYLDMFVDKYKSKMVRLMQYIGIKNGVVGIQGFCNGSSIVFTEMGYRLGGTSQQDYTKALYGFSNMEYMINYAICGIMTDEECRENPYYPYECCTLSLISKGGKIGKITGLEYVQAIPEVIKIENHYKPGDIVEVTNNISQLHFRIFIVAKTLERVKEIITSVYDNLEVFDDDGNYMLDEKMDVERLGKQ